MKTCIYLIPCFDHWTGRKDDIPMQKEACHEFAERQGWEIVKEFSEKGVSGFKKSAKDRDQLQLLQQAAAAGEFDVLLVFMFDRLGRRDDETPFIVEWFTKQGVEVWSVNEGQQRFDSHVDKLMNYIRYWQASGESIKTSIRTRTRIEQLTEEGHYTGGIVAFGYKRVQKGRLNKKNQAVCDLEINEEEAAVVRLIFQKYVYEGYGAKRICNYLVEHNIMGRNGKNIPNITIGRMIRNKGYTGYLINGNVEKNALSCGSSSRKYLKRLRSCGMPAAERRVRTQIRTVLMPCFVVKCSVPTAAIV